MWWNWPHVVVDAAPDDQRLARHDRLRDALAGPQAAHDRQRDAEVLAHQAREGVKRLFLFGRFDRVAHQAARESRQHGAGVAAVAALGPQRRALQERVGRLQRGRLARRDQQSERARREEVEEVVAVVARRRPRRRRRCPGRGARASTRAAAPRAAASAGAPAHGSSRRLRTGVRRRRLVVSRLLPFQPGLQAAVGPRHAEQGVLARRAKIEVDHHDPPPQARDRRRQVARRRCSCPCPAGPSRPR